MNSEDKKIVMILHQLTSMIRLSDFENLLEAERKLCQSNNVVPNMVVSLNYGRAAQAIAYHEKISSAKKAISNLTASDKARLITLYIDKPRDLFEFSEELPTEVLEIISKFNLMGGDTYKNCKALEAELLPLGFSFEWDLSGEPYNLHKIEQH